MRIFKILKFYNDKKLSNTNFKILIIHKPSLGSREVPHKIWARDSAVLTFIGYKQTDRHDKFIYRLIEKEKTDSFQENVCTIGISNVYLIRFDISKFSHFILPCVKIVSKTIFLWFLCKGVHRGREGGSKSMVSRGF